MMQGRIFLQEFLGDGERNTIIVVGIAPVTFVFIQSDNVP